MKELKKAFNEVIETYKTVWSRKSHFTRIINVLFLIAVLPTLLVLVLSLGAVPGFGWVGYLFQFISMSFLTYPTTTSLVLVLIVFIIPILAGLIGVIGFVSKIKSIIAHKNESVKGIFAQGAKKFFPLLWLLVITMLPLLASVAALLYIEINVWFGTIAIVASLWILVTSFARFALLLDGETVHNSLIKSIPVVLKNIPALILRAIVSSATILLPALLITACMSLLHTIIVKALSGYPTLTMAALAIEEGPFTLSESITSTVFDIVGIAFSMFVLLPIMIVYVVRIFDECKKTAEVSKKNQTRIYNTVIGIYAVTAVIALIVAYKVIL